MFVGDENQLQPIGKGSFFHSLVKSNSIPHKKLTQNNRQSNDSYIHQLAESVKDGDKNTFINILHKTNNIRILHYNQEAIKNTFNKYNY